LGAVNGRQRYGFFDKSSGIVVVDATGFGGTTSFFAIGFVASAALDAAAVGSTPGAGAEA
jgi:hypothetical protein